MKKLLLLVCTLGLTIATTLCSASCPADNPITLKESTNTALYKLLMTDEGANQGSLSQDPNKVRIQYCENGDQLKWMIADWYTLCDDNATTVVAAMGGGGNARTSLEAAFKNTGTGAQKNSTIKSVKWCTNGNFLYAVCCDKSCNGTWGTVGTSSILGAKTQQWTTCGW